MTESGNCGVEWASVSLPRVLLTRVDAIFEERGYSSRADYIRSAIQRQLDADEGRL